MEAERAAGIAVGMEEATAEAVEARRAFDFGFP